MAQRFLSAYLTLSPLDLLLSGTSDSWKQFFPFSATSGLWTFSGRVALYAGLPRLKLRPGSTILVPSYFQGTEIDTLLAAGHKLRFYRIDSKFRVDLTDVEARLDGDVSALYVIHYFGLPQPIRMIEHFCRTRGIALIEDCALSLFSRDGDTWLGSRGDLALFSVYKSLSLPHGGFLVTREGEATEALENPPPRSTFFQTADLVAQHLKGLFSSDLVEKVWSATAFARQALAKKTIVSGTITLDPKTLRYGASPLAVRLMSLVDPEYVILKRRENFEHLHSMLAGVVHTPLNDLPPGGCPLFFPVLVEDKVALRKELAARGVGSVNLWSHDHPACPADLAAEVAPWRRGILELPVHQQLDPEDIERIGRTVRSVLGMRTVFGAPPKRDHAHPSSAIPQPAARQSVPAESSH